MKFKKLISTVCIFLAVSSALSAPAFAASENHVSKQVLLIKNQDPLSTDTSILYIKPETYPGGENEEVQFKIHLEGPAKWLYSDTHALKTGLNILTVSETELVVTATPEYMETSERITIPLFVKATGNGYISARIESLGSVVSSGSYQFASCGTGAIYLEGGMRPTTKGNVEIADVAIKDTGALSIPKGTRFTLNLSNGYLFSPNQKIIASGKFTDKNISFTVDKSNNSIAYIDITADTSSQTGAIILSNPYLRTNGNASNGSIELHLSAGHESRKYTVATFYDENLDKKSSQSSSGGSTLIFTIGSTELKKDSALLTLDAAPYINKDGYSMIPVRAAAEAFGVGDISWNSETRTVSMTNESSQKISLTIGNADILINGEVSLTSPALPEIKDGRTFLPLRSLATVLGVTDDGISYDPNTKAVTLIKK